MELNSFTTILEKQIKVGLTTFETSEKIPNNFFFQAQENHKISVMNGNDTEKNVKLVDST